MREFELQLQREGGSHELHADAHGDEEAWGTMR